MDDPIVASTRYMDAPRIAAHLAVLYEAALHIGLDVDFQILAAKRTRDQELVFHFLHPTAPTCVGERSNRIRHDGNDDATTTTQKAK